MLGCITSENHDLIRKGIAFPNIGGGASNRKTSRNFPALPHVQTLLELATESLQIKRKRFYEIQSFIRNLLNLR